LPNFLSDFLIITTGVIVTGIIAEHLGGTPLSFMVVWVGSFVVWVLCAILED